MTPERMPWPGDDNLSDSQKRVRADVVSGPRGRIGGPFNALIRAPELMSHLERLGVHLRFADTMSLPAGVREFAVLIVSRRWTQRLEWSAHRPLARQLGVPDKVCAAIALGNRPEGEPWGATWDFLHELEETRAVSDTTYSAISALYSERQIVELIALAGYYTTLAMVLNVNRTPAAADDLPELPAAPGQQA